MSVWFMPEVVPNALIRVFCFSYAGGGASTFRSWPRDASLGVVPVQLPGRENRMGEAPLTSMSEVVEQVAEAMKPWIGTPYALFGHSLGARIAFEVARFMRLHGESLPIHLFVSGSRSPEIPEPRPLHDLDEDEFLIDELVGLSVYDESDNKIGFIIGVSNNGATDLLSVKTKSNKISLVPFVKAIVTDVDIKNRRIQINNLEGLLE